MAVTSAAPRWDELFAARTRGDVGEGIAAVLAFLGVPDLISFAGGFPDPTTFPRERAVRAARGVRRRGRVGRVPVRADARPRRAARRARRPARATAGPPAGRGRAADHERRDRGARAGRQDVPRPRRPRRRRGPDAISARSWPSASFEAEIVAVPMDEHGLEVDELERRLADGAPAEARLHDPRPPESGRRQPRRPNGASCSSSSRGATAS